MKAAVAIQWKGDFSVAEKGIASVPAEFDPGGLMTFARVWILMLERKFPALLGDRLITAVELSDPEEAAKLGYSPAMIRETINFFPAPHARRTHLPG